MLGELNVQPIPRLLKLPNFFHPFSVTEAAATNDVPSDSDTVSMDGNLYDLALGTDIQNLTGTDEEIEPLSDEEDGINVTPGIKP